MPEGTNLLKVRRDPATREITWLCYRSTANTFPYRQPDSSEIYLGKETDQCSEPTLQVGGVDGKVMVVKGQVGVAVRVASNRFDWWCGGNDHHIGTLEHTTAPELTNLVRVTRAALSREITWECFLERKAAPTPPNDIIAATFTAPHRVDVYTRNTLQGMICTSSSNAEGADWLAPWTELPSGAFLSGPAACASADGRSLHVFGRGMDNAIWRAHSPDGGASWDLAWVPIGDGVFSSGPAAALSADGRSLLVFGRGMDDRMYWSHLPDGGASWDLVWAPIGDGVFISSPAAAISPDGRVIHVFGVGKDRQIWRALSLDSGGSWTVGWAPIGGGMAF
jgi:hypothetical protein